jgi:LysR family transcriptional activator of nhaA
MKTFARAGAGVFVAPLVIAEEMQRVQRARLLGALDSLRETYYAVSTERRVSHPAVRALIEAAATIFTDRK